MANKCPRIGQQSRNLTGTIKKYPKIGVIIPGLKGFSDYRLPSRPSATRVRVLAAAASPRSGRLIWTPDQYYLDTGWNSGLSLDTFPPSVLSSAGRQLGKPCRL
eukprot:scaffold98546_cov23-Prasinocladus_malaysianus.AAC.1